MWVTMFLAPLAAVADWTQGLIPLGIGNIVLKVMVAR